MKFSISAAILTCLLFSCSEEKKRDHFSLEIYTTDGLINLRYTLSENGLVINESAAPIMSTRTTGDYSFVISDTDSLNYIAKLDIKAKDCNEQHALAVDSIRFSNDTISVRVDPNVNHSKELDCAVRLINSVVPADYILEFLDMQPAIEPDGSLRI